MKAALLVLILCFAFIAGCSSESEQHVTVTPDYSKEIPKIPAMAEVRFISCKENNTAIEIKNVASEALPAGVDFTVVGNDGKVGTVDFDRPLEAGATLKYYVVDESGERVRLAAGVAYSMSYSSIPTVNVVCGSP
jgi:hypothetical protein